jgi:uncharacterized RDD family membrane protein YckC
MSDTAMHVQSPTMVPGADARPLYAGFWRRVCAYIIDWVIVSSCVSIVFISLAAAIPGVGKVVALRTPFDLFTTERTIESRTVPGEGGVVTEKIIERTVIGHWVYFYRVTEEKGEKGRSGTWHWQQIDPGTRLDIETTTMRQLVWIVLLVYWILMEASRFQGSLGKMVLGLKVVDERGRRLTVLHATFRNLFKIVSVLTLFIGFLMAGWTRRKQALHDKVAKCYVVIEEPDARAHHSA